MRLVARRRVLKCTCARVCGRGEIEKRDSAQVIMPMEECSWWLPTFSATLKLHPHPLIHELIQVLNVCARIGGWVGVRSIEAEATNTPELGVKVLRQYCEQPTRPAVCVARSTRTYAQARARIRTKMDSFFGAAPAYRVVRWLIVGR